MRVIPVKVDSNYKEYMPFRDPTFPVDIWTDAYDTFVDETLNCHWHPAYELAVLLSGTLDFYATGIHMQIFEGDCIFINSNIMHTAKQSPECRGSVIKGVAFPASLITNDTNSAVYRKYFEPVATTPMHSVIIRRNEIFASEMASMILAICELKDKEFGFELSCLSLLSRLWKGVLFHILSNKPELMQHRINRKYEDRMKKILSYIHENYAENITVDNLANHVNISRSECFRSFKHFTNKKPIEYINDYRLACASSLLIESTLSVTEIGVVCGFSNSSYFGKLFRQRYGVPPGQYRYRK